jgi:signal transduction histidine kinase/CheY-like chemotaxis protein
MTEARGSATPGAPSEGGLLAGWLSQMAESESMAARFAALAESIREGVAILTRDRLHFANSALRGLLEIDAETLPTVPLRRLVQDPERRRALRAAIRAAWEGRPGEVGSVPIRARDGRHTRIRVAFRPLAREAEAGILVVVDAGGRDAAPTGAVTPEDSLRAFGLYLAGLASELRAPFAASLDHLRDLLARTDLPLDVKETLGLYQTVVGETLERVRRSMEWGRRESAGECRDLGAVVRAATAAVEAARSASVTIALELAPVPPVAGWADQLQLAVEHLLRNALEALGERGGRIEVRLAAEGGRATLTVADDGPGIPPSLLPHVFEPFSSTKSIATGRGLGLAIVRDIVTRQGGEVSLASGTGGCVVTVSLVAQPSRTAAPRRAAPGTVLIVDDLPEIQDTFRALLADAGWDVLSAGSTEEALRLLAQHPVDALLLDVRMPGRDGLGLVEAVALWHPHLLPRIALHTGYADEPRVRALAKRYGLALLEKPCPRGDLLSTLDALRARARR